MSTYNASEVFQFAIRIEENGEKFYRELADQVSDNSIKNLFNSLAEEEIEHAKLFEEMLISFESYEPSELYPEEYFLYLKAFADNAIFEKEKLDEQIAKINNPIDAIQFAIRLELDSILYYQEMKKLVPPDQHNLLDKILEQERIHFLRLSNTRDNLGH